MNEMHVSLVFKFKMQNIICNIFITTNMTSTSQFLVPVQYMSGQVSSLSEVPKLEHILSGISRDKTMDGKLTKLLLLCWLK